ncbi:MAG: hypothetical protein M3143_13335 [Actinomycetota bacterium]|nr:hypothetical protein [Actinomycetota bacterium]
MITSLERGRYDWPWRGGTSFVTPDGSQVILSSSALDASRPWSCGFIALVRGARRAFTVAEAGAFDWHSTYTTIPDQLSRQPYRGGELVTGIRTDPGDYRTAWRGQWFELHTRASGSPDGIMGVFDAFRLTDTPLGMLVQPRSARQAQLEPIRVAKQIPRLGHLTIERPGTSQLTIPDFRGHLTRHGELWRQPLGIGAHGRSRPEALVLATPTAITQLIPGPADTADPEEALQFLAGLDVIWEPT